MNRRAFVLVCAAACVLLSVPSPLAAATVASPNDSHDQPFTVAPNDPITRQVPAPGSPAVHGSGWWVACTQYYASIYSGKQRAGSNAVQFTA